MTVNAKKTEFICMGCWGTFSPQATADGDVICPHCGARQDLQHEPIDLDPEEFVELDPELAGAGAESATKQPGEGDQGSSGATDEDFDAVIEIDLDEIDATTDFVDAGQYTEPIPEPRAPADEPRVQPRSQPQAAEASLPQSHLYLRTERGTYTFLSPESLIIWARRLKQPQKSLQMSLDGVDWQAFLPFLSRMVATGQVSGLESEIGVIEDDERKVSDEDLARSLDEEKRSFEGTGPVTPSHGEAKADQAEGKVPDAEPARGVGDFTFKVDERVENPGLRYALMAGVGVALGAGVVTILALLGLLPPPPF